jgi:tryptophanyl-tRNA synthetase
MHDHGGSMKPEVSFPFRLVSGFRPLKGLHLGHYAAVLTDLTRLQYMHERSAFIFIADHHARSRWNERADFANTERRAIETTRQLLAAGVDPDFSVIYRQSDVPEIFEVMWFLAGFALHSQMQHMQGLKGAAPSAGTYIYPLLMVADIIATQSTHVAVGQDQKQHLELSRDLARKLNRRLGEQFIPVPESARAEPTTVRGIDFADSNRKKMAFELGNEIPLFEDEDVVTERIENIVTQPVQFGHPLPAEGCNLLEFSSFLVGAEQMRDLRDKYASGKYGYADAKRDLRKAFFEVMGPARARYLTIHADDAAKVLDEGKIRARENIAHFIFRLRQELAISV